MPSNLPENCQNLLETFIYENKPMNGKEIRTAFKDFIGEPFLQHFSKPKNGVSFADYLLDIINKYELPIRQTEEESGVFEYFKEKTKKNKDEDKKTNKPKTHTADLVEVKISTPNFDEKEKSQKEKKVQSAVFNQALKNITNQKISLPSKLTDFLTNILKTESFIDTEPEKLQAIFKKYGSEKGVNYQKYGYESMKQLILSVDGVFENKEVESSIVFYKNPRERLPSIDELPYVVKKMEFSQWLKTEFIRNYWGKRHSLQKSFLAVLTSS